MNYGNRNASSTYTVTDLGKGYSGAVAVSMSIALFTRKIFAKQLAPLKGPSLIFANSFLAILAGSSAGAANLILMRQKELKQGVTVTNKDGSKEYGKSKVAGKKAIQQTAISRIVLPVPVLCFPAIGNLLLTKMRLMPKSSNAAKVIELILCGMSLTFALPMSIALFE